MDNTAAPIPPISPQPAVVSPAESSSRRWLLWLFGGIALLALGAALGLFTAKFFSQSTTQPQISTYQDCLAAKGSLVQESYPATCVTASGQRFVQPLTDEEKQSLQPPDLYRKPTSSAATANWKTYTNSRYSFKYPQTWETQSIPNGTQQVVSLLSPDKFMSLSLSLDLQGLGYECVTKTKEETITLDAQKVTKTTFTGAINDMCGDNTKQRDVWISIPRENKIDHLTFSTDEKNFDKAMEIFDQILSTFKFTD